ncbi:thiamine diphosphokinase [Ruminococcus sp. AM28-41]|jgi:thiamine pyrophosphokinase|nr:thiamine diphosphokinase [uncultured Blautia sp.]RGW21083.1 thiamine diphosphokinase [Ruminococcus sp. AF13-37]RGW23669.1 thiamine diphosphokinase [Ruminococcus sp. AF13-28]RHG57979.1 thiamine diphosphokinase [Ruminococcus sp. AM22-13]RHO92938.1 thiamine diphosphokinase [Ruminococcus sp. AF42-9BH]RHT54270.1 thiamine diphosphokinase [Ruminococcus sp. AM29-26]RHT66901.1 thiamine diphosphokinase [Ruminococcus sp. AM28-41]RHU90078.1 thiamine diphosphokinase [Ruminococcus sp. OM08-7]
MIDTIIVSGGDIQSDFALYFLKKNIEKAGRENIRLIAADRGLEFFLDYLILPDVVIGDFDSLSEDGKNFLEMQNEDIPYGGMLEWKLQKGEGKVVEVVRLRPEKDDSDTQSAMNYAIQNGAKEIVILGVTGNRVDHLMANFGLLILAQKQDTEVALADRYNYMKLIPSGTILKKAEQFGKYVSFFPLGGDVTGLTLEGFKYPLDKYHLTTADSGLTVSNEISEEYAKVTYESGTLLMIMSRD